MRIAAPIRFLLWSGICQLIGFAAGVFSGAFLQALPAQVLIHAMTALLLSRLLGLTLPWQALNLLLPFGVPLFQGISVPPWFFSMVVLTILLIYLPTFWTRVPFYPTSREMYEVVLRELPKGTPFNFLDLGSGFGSLLVFLARHCPGSHFTGVEISPLPFFVARLRSLLFAGRISINMQNFWNMELSEYDVIYAFLAPGPMPALWEKCRKEMKPGSTLLINSFRVPATPERVIQVNDRRKTVLYVHRM